MKERLLFRKEFVMNLRETIIKRVSEVFDDGLSDHQAFSSEEIFILHHLLSLVVVHSGNEFLNACSDIEREEEE